MSHIVVRADLQREGAGGKQGRSREQGRLTKSEKTMILMSRGVVVEGIAQSWLVVWDIRYVYGVDGGGGRDGVDGGQGEYKEGGGVVLYNTVIQAALRMARLRLETPV